MMNPARAGSLGWMAAVAMTAALASAAFGQGQEYVQASAKIVGTEILSFTDAGENVAIVLGDFSLTIGDRVISGRDAVVWIATIQAGYVPRNKITVYVEGADGGSDESGGVLLITLANEGRLTASGNLSDRPLKDFPLYQRALEARRASVKPKAVATRPAASAKPAAAAPAGVPPAPLTFEITPAESPAGTQPAVKGKEVVPAAKAAAGVPQSAPAPPPPPQAAQPINFHADRFTSELQPDRRVTIAYGNVYLSQGQADSDLFLELRSQSAVIFSKRDVPEKKDVRPPVSPRLPRLDLTGETITGVYLEEDVVIARGERYFRGPAAYYDFTTDRAIVLEPVFRTVQEQRNVPIYVRAREARALSAREVWFSDAKVSTSEFFTPSYHIGARSAYLMDNTPYDQQGRRLGEQAWLTRMKHVTFNVGGVPMFYVPFVQGDLEQGNSPLRKAQFGKHGNFGWGFQTEWDLFRLLGLLKPSGAKGRLDLDWLERGTLAGASVSYDRDDYSGYHEAYGIIDDRKEDDFGSERKDIDAPGQRGRLLMRHKQFLPEDWQLQFELSYICDRNFLEEFFPNEFYAGKEQETLLHLQKQKDNWAFTSLLKGRLNRFATQQESLPDLGFWLLGEPLAGDRLSFFNETHAGVKHLRYANYISRADISRDDSDYYGRLDSRDEIDLPLKIGPINAVPYATGRATYWGDRFAEDGATCRPYGQIGVKSDTHVWRVYENVESRLWDLHRLKHVITPELTGWVASAHGVTPQKLSPISTELMNALVQEPYFAPIDELYPLDGGIEEHLTPASGLAAGIRQRLQTKRGPADNRQTVDWMRFNLSMGIYDNGDDSVPSDGRFFSSRPEYSLDRNHLNGEYSWNISDSTVLLSDVNYDMDGQRLGRGNIGLAVQRDPRLRYYYGLRYTDDLNSAVGTFGVNYKISRKYSISAFEQYDFAFQDGRNLSTTVTITRKLPRWYAGVTIAYENTTNELTLLITFWPEGIEEVRLGGGSLSFLGKSDSN